MSVAAQDIGYLQIGSEYSVLLCLLLSCLIPLFLPVLEAFLKTPDNAGLNL